VVYETMDCTAALINFWRHYFYRVIATGPDAEHVVSEVKTYETSPTVPEEEIISRNLLLHESYTGVPCFAFIERTAEAPPCHCVDPTTYRTRVSDCLTCLGTGKQRPYFQPIQVFVDWNPPAKMVQIAQFGEMQPGQVDVWWGAFPLLKPRDVFLEVVSGELYRIVMLHPVRPQRTTIQQVARLEQINRSDVEYRSPLFKVDPAVSKQLIAVFDHKKHERRF
jgi:hypothetical protein